jgi:preprotein translocase subunit SecY
MLSTLRNIANIGRIPDLRNKVLFTLAMVVIYRIGAFIPSPGINFDAVAAIRARTELEGGGVLDFLALFSGGALTQMAIFALGVFPYITASIIMQILGIVIPRIEQWQNQGAVGQRKITQSLSPSFSPRASLFCSTARATALEQGHRVSPATGSTCCQPLPLPVLVSLC